MRAFVFVLILFLLGTGVYASSDFEIHFLQPQPQIYQLEFDLFNIDIREVSHEASIYTDITFNSGIFTEQRGYAQIPFTSVSVQLPALKDVDISVTTTDFEGHVSIR